MAFRFLLTYTIYSLLLAPAATANPADTSYQGWYFTPTGVFGRLPLDHPKNRSYVRLSHPSPNLTIIASLNPAGIVTNSTRVYFSNGLLSLSTETDRWGDTYDSTWYEPDGQDKFMVTERKQGVNPFWPCKYLEYTFKNDQLADIVCYVDSVRPGPTQEGVAHYVFQRYEDPLRRGLIRTETFFTEIDMPAISRVSDCHKIINDYDNKDNLLSRSIYDQDDKPVPDRYGVFRTTYKYDNDGNETELAYFDTKGKETISAWGYAEKDDEYKRGLLTTETYYSDHITITRSSPLAGSVSIIRHKYDQDGNETETQYFDADNQAMANADGVHRTRYEYSPTGMLMRINKIGINATGWDNKMYALMKLDRDDKGRVTAMRLQSNTGINIPNPSNGAIITRYSYDASGRIHSQSCWQDDSTRMACSFGEYEIIRRYDDEGQVIEVDHLDVDGNPSTSAIGYSKELIKYNEEGLPAERAFYSGDQPILLNDSRSSMSNFHRVRFSYDLLNRLRAVSFFDVAGHPVNAALRDGKKINLKAEEVDLDYDGAQLTGESVRDSGDVTPPVALDCSKGQCLPETAFDAITRTMGDNGPERLYHGHIRPDTLYDGQWGFVGQDSVLVFLASGSGSQTGMACADLYRVEPVNQFYQLDGRVTDFYMDNDSLAATYTYDRGVLQGPVYLYYKNGLIREQGTYQNNLKAGLWQYFFDNGQKERTLQYVNGQPLVLDCFTKTGEVLVRDGNGQFVGKVALGADKNGSLLATARGPVKKGLPDGEWNIYDGVMTGPSFVETFSEGKFRHGVSFSLAGKSTYSDKWFTRLDGPHSYESLDHYQQARDCRPAGAGSFYGDLYPEIRKGFTDIINSPTYISYSGWVFLDLGVDSTGHVVSTTVRLYRPNEVFAKAIREMAGRLVYQRPRWAKASRDPVEKLYIILVDGKELAIPEELLQNQRRMLIN